MPDCIIIRKGGPDDAGLLAALCTQHAAYEKLAPCPSDLAQRLAEMLQPSRPRIHTMLAWDGPHALGYASASRNWSTLGGAAYLHLDCLFIVPGYRGQGLGARLFDAMAAHARELGVAQMQWQTPDWNHDAVRFYRRRSTAMLGKQGFQLTLGDLPAHQDREQAI